LSTVGEYGFISPGKLDSAAVRLVGPPLAGVVAVVALGVLGVVAAGALDFEFELDPQPAIARTASAASEVAATPRGQGPDLNIFTPVVS
jgi:hypothetical protein